MPRLSRRNLVVPYLMVLAISVPAVPATVTGELPRIASRPLEALAGATTEYGELRTKDGARLRTLVTRPRGVDGTLPAVLFVQWLSCDTIELGPDPRDGWSLMLKRLITDSRMVVMRTEKSGVGDSLGVPCAELDYQTELEHHREALQALRQRADVDPDRIVVFGASMGATMAPLVVGETPVRGIAVWGGGARTWLERMLAFDRRAMELGGRPTEEIAPAMARHVAFQLAYLVDGIAPDEIARRDPNIGAVWREVVGADGEYHYGRPLAFHRQAQRQNWAAAWARVSAPVLVMLGGLDWFEEPRAAELIAEVVNRQHPGHAEFHLFPGLDHHFVRYADAETAFREERGAADPDVATNVLLPWLERVMRH